MKTPSSALMGSLCVVLFWYSLSFLAIAAGAMQPHPKLPDIDFQTDDGRENTIPRQVLNLARKARDDLLAEGPQPEDPPSEEEAHHEETDEDYGWGRGGGPHEKRKTRRGGWKHPKKGSW